MKRILLILSLIVVLLPAASAQTGGRQSNHLPVGVNISLWKGVSTQHTDTVGSTALNIGLFSSMNRLNGLGLNILGAVVVRDVNGLQVSGLANITGGSMRGLQLSALTNINGNDLTGVAMTGLVGITGNNAKGIVFSGLTNIVGSGSRGVLVGGTVNIVGRDTKGIELAGVSNISGGNFTGLMAATLMNVVGDTLRGLQVSGLLNVAAGGVEGVQAGALNVATRAKGLQVGVMNVYTERLDGFQLGLINANPDTQIEFTASTGTSSLLNAGFRFKNRLYYTILALGYDYYKLDRTNYTATYRAGLWLPVSGQLSASGDVGVQHVETFHRAGTQPARLFALQARLSGEYSLNDKLNIFVSAGYDHSRDYHGHKFRGGLFIEAGTYITLGGMRFNVTEQR